MFSHVMVGTNDLERAKKFYDAVLGTLGVKPAVIDGHRMFYRTKTGVFGVTKPINGEAATFANGGTIGFAVDTPEQAHGLRDPGRLLAPGCGFRPAATILTIGWQQCRGSLFP